MGMINNPFTGATGIADSNGNGITSDGHVVSNGMDITTGQQVSVFNDCSWDDGSQYMSKRARAKKAAKKARRKAFWDKIL